MVHLPALPGSASASRPLAEIADRAVTEARLLARADFQAVIVENFGDSPFAADCVPAETVASMAIIVREVVAAVRIPVGVNVLRNDALAALGVAAVTGAAFIRVNILSGTYATDQGLISGGARELLQRRDQVARHVRIAADVHVKHAAPISQPDLILAAEETAYRAGADVLIVSGAATGSPADLDAAARVKAAVPDRPLWIGSGVDPTTVAACLGVADAVIVGTCLKRGGKTTAALDHRRLRSFSAVAAGVRRDGERAEPRRRRG
jgi:membrane complex biogenesis BtpA family protein